MKVTRSIKSAINRRANEVAQQLTPKLVARLTELIEAEEIMPMYIEHWWPTSFDPILCNWGVSGGRHEAPADVCGNCDSVLPEGCGGRFRGDMSCERRKRGLVNLCGVGYPFADAAPPYRKPGEADPGFDATDLLDTF